MKTQLLPRRIGLTRLVASQVGLGLAVLGIFGASKPAMADDGYYSIASSEYIYGSKVSVQMVRERVKIFVDMKGGLSFVKATPSKCICRFVFKNSGPATTVTMAFPEYGSAQYQGGKNPTSEYTDFRSYVDGKKVATKAIWSKKNGAIEHVKTVHFKAHQTLVVEDYFTQLVSTQGLSKDGVNNFGALYFVPYILGTGGSWKQSLDRAEIDLTEVNSSKPLRLGQIPPTYVLHYPKGEHRSSPSDKIVYISEGHFGPPETVWVSWEGAHVTVSDRTVTCIRRNFKPKKKEMCWFYIGWESVPKPQPGQS